MAAYRYLFGPVPSRRFGRSLGVDLVPFKTCTLDCLFCQLGRTPHPGTERREYVPTEAVLSELREWFASGQSADHIALGGSGEPTLHTRFGEVLDYLRQTGRCRSVLLTNGTLLGVPEVSAAACRADVVKISLSAWDPSSYERVNRPHPDFHFGRLLDGYRAFRAAYRGELWLEVFLMAGLNDAPDDVRKIAGLAETFRPDRVHLNTAVRPPAESEAQAVPAERLESLCPLFTPRAEVIAGAPPPPAAAAGIDAEHLLALLSRHPSTADELAGALGVGRQAVDRQLTALAGQDRIQPVARDGRTYWSVAKQESPS